jgi:ribosomal peptide maturation radical SAM protein 1
VNPHQTATPPIVLWSLPALEPRQAPAGLCLVSALLSDADLAHELRHRHVDFGQRLATKLGQAEAGVVATYGTMCDMAAGWALRLHADPNIDIPEELAHLLDAEAFPRQAFSMLAEELLAQARDDVASLIAAPPRVAGFTLTIAQTGASILWATLIKEALPEVTVVFGGSQCEDPMGIALLAGTPCVDIVVRGEADASIVPLFSALLTDSDLTTVEGVAFRSPSGLVTTGKPELGPPSDRAPDYSAFARRFAEAESDLGYEPNFYVEGSRGCWWGEVKHCTFCGIHTSGIEFRAKSVDSTLAEINRVIDETRSLTVVLSDTIMSTEHIHQLLPQLEEMRRDVDVEILVDLKNNLRRQDVQALARAGVSTVQLGVESLSTNLLRRMRKGNTALQHVQALKWLTECGIGVFYNILTHVPFETPADYEASARIAARIYHLCPPSGIFPIEIDRYAPYFVDWERYGFPEPVPSPIYQWILPPDSIVDLHQFAYVFEGRHASTQSAELDTARETLAKTIDQWQHSYATQRLTHRRGPDFMVISRATPSGSQRRVLEGPDAQLYGHLDRVRQYRALVRAMNGILSEDRVRSTLQAWREDGLCLDDGNNWLALSVQHRRLTPA